MTSIGIGQLRVGDRIVAESHRLGAVARRGEIVELLGEPGGQRCRVRWDDGHETLVYPGATIRPEREPLDEQDVVE